MRTVRGPFVCGDGLDILSDEILTGSWLAHNSLKVQFSTHYLILFNCLFAVNYIEGRVKAKTSVRKRFYFF